MAGPNPLDYFAIQNTLSRYAMAIDNKDFHLLHQVFTSDFDAVYQFVGHFVEVQKLADALKESLASVTTNHALTTQHIEMAPGGASAQVTTYFTAVHFGTGKWEGKELTAWGKYIDVLTLFPDGKTNVLPGSSGQWLVSKRELVFFNMLGEQGVMGGG